MSSQNDTTLAPTSATERISFPPVHIIPSSEKHTHTAILLHGHSGTATSFAARLLALRPSASTNTSISSDDSLTALFPTLRLVFPGASTLYSRRLNAHVSSWFEAASYSDMRVGQALQLPGLAASVRHILRIIDDEVKLLGGDAQRVVLGGWSQGSATGLWTVICGAASRNVEKSLGGFFGIGPWMSFVDELSEVISDVDGEDETTERNAIKGIGFLKQRIDLPGDVNAEAAKNLANTPVLLGHGIDDAVVPISLGRNICAVLRRMGMTVEWQEFTGASDEGHWVKEPEQFDGIVKFLKQFVETSKQNR